MQLTHVRLLVVSFDACLRFYRDVLGFRLTWGEEGSGYASFDTGAATLSLFDRRAMARAVGAAHLPPGAICQDRTALIFDAGDLDAVVQELEARGAEFLVGPKSHPEWGIRTAHLRDPDGNLIELNARLPKSEWTDDLRREDDRYDGSSVARS